MNVFRIEIAAANTALAESDAWLRSRLADAGLKGVVRAWSTRLFLMDGGLSYDDACAIAGELLMDPVTENTTVHGLGETVPTDAARRSLEVFPKPGVMDPVAESTLAELRAAGYAVSTVRTGRRILVTGDVSESAFVGAVRRFLAREVIEDVIPGTAGVFPAPQPVSRPFQLRRVAIRDLDEDGLERLSREGHLFLSRDEMRAIQAHFRERRRDPTDLELETLAQTWSEHCVHKTLKSAVVYHGEPIPTMPPQGGPDAEYRFENLLKDTIARATHELIAGGRGPMCLSVFQDNAGVIAFDEFDGIAFKVETHNRPSAIEPYGGAATGVGGCIRDVLGCGLGARPIANTDVFCLAPRQWPIDAVPRGVLHPDVVLRGVVDGVGDYGNRMGIPTVNGAIHFDPRYLGNPLVFCGCVGLIPRNRIEKAARPGDKIVLIGGRTGRDGIHGATFSSAELTDSHADEFSHAVQIGNAITEKRVLDALLKARDWRPADAAGASPTRCLYHAVTDCGAGGLSSAIGEMAESVGATVDLEAVPLKYAGLRYDEIWISEAQERMVLAVPPTDLAALLEIMREEEVEASVIGEFGVAGPRLVVRFNGNIVGELDMQFLHHGLPRRVRSAIWRPRRGATHDPTPAGDSSSVLDRLIEALAAPTIAGKEWVIRRYDHEVQGGSVVKPLCGPGHGPADAAVIRPKLDSQRGIAIGCGLAPELSDVDPYWMAAASIDEALNNVVCVGGDPGRTAILDNFCWGRCDDPQQMGALVRACRACYDAAVAWSTPFISGKDSLNNEFVLDPDDVPRLLAVLQGMRHPSEAGSDPSHAWAETQRKIRDTGRLSIPPTLLISALSVMDDVRGCITPDCKRSGAALFLVGGLPRVSFDLAQADRVRRGVAEAIRQRRIAACHDCSSGWAVAAAEMAIAGDRGARLTGHGLPHDPLTPLAAGFVVEAAAVDGSASLEEFFAQRGVPARRIGVVAGDGHRALFELLERSVAVEMLRRAWLGS